MKISFSQKSVTLYLLPLLALILIIVNPLEEYPSVTRMMAVVFLMAGWWISEAVPIAITSLIPIILFPVLGIMDGGQTAMQYFNDVIFLFMGGFIIALALEKWDLHLRIAYRALLFFGSKPFRILLGFMVTSSALSMWISNTATAILMFPIALSVIREMEHIHGKENLVRFKIGLLLGIAYSCSIGGIATLIGTPPNLALVAIFEKMYPDGPSISFGNWMIFALPVYILQLGMAALVLFTLFSPPVQSRGAFRKYIKEEHAKLGKTTYEQKWIFFLFMMFALLLIFKNDLSVGRITLPGWSRIFRNPEFLKDGTIAILIATMLFIIPSLTQPGNRLMDWQSAVKLPWGIILLFGGGFALAKGSVESGLTGWLGGLMSGLADTPPLVFIGINASLMAFLTEFTSNISTSQILLPVIAALSESVRINPLFLMIPVTVASSFAFMLPIATPPNAIIFGSGHLRIRNMILPGLILNITGIIIVSIVMYFWGTTVFEIEPSQFPNWAIRDLINP
ncbi:MAG: SLC13/DASS family transporter [Bacteroidales bacterium]|nr:SLC13/DASS family transporter [Bacteroidales bacterium]MBN2699219.1 SLC13/DASS family transporter [Bacteroidales bacterium]